MIVYYLDIEQVLRRFKGGCVLLSSDIDIFRGNLIIPLAIEFFEMVLEVDPQKAISFKFEDYEYMTLSKDLEGVYEAYGFDFDSKIANKYPLFDLVCETKKGKIFMLMQGWR